MAQLPVRLGLIGLGMMGRAHLKVIAASEAALCVAGSDPLPAARQAAAASGLAVYETYDQLLDTERLDGVIVAAPNAEHVPAALEAIARGIPVLVEKPLSDSVESGRALCAAAEAHRVPVLVGHHRRHNAAVQRARRAVQEGLIGRPSVAQVTSLLLKPASYFEMSWRRAAGSGGPVLINLIHEIDLLRFIFGELSGLQALTSSSIRGFAVEDTAVVALRFVNGALGTITLSDTAVSPYSWDLSSGEFAQMTNTTETIRRQAVHSHVFAGTAGSVTLPTLDYFSYGGGAEPGWLAELKQTNLSEANPPDAYSTQIRHFAEVIRGQATPLISAADGLGTLAATLAVKASAESGSYISLG